MGSRTFYATSGVEDAPTVLPYRFNLHSILKYYDE